MRLDVQPGKYILGVSGGVDSMALLDLLADKPGVELVVAHFNHGIRKDSSLDEKLVKQTARHYKLPVEIGTADRSLSSEASAREARYKFLLQAQEKHKADKIITAHHQDDKIETALLNLLRGSGRKGLSAISDNQAVLRPLLNIPKKEIIDYARRRNLAWREDSTNLDTGLLRNYLRIKVIPKLDTESRAQLISNLDKVAKTNKILDIYIATISHNIYQNHVINRQKFSELPIEIEKELLAYWLRTEDLGEFDKKTLDRLVIAIKTARPGSLQPIKQNNTLEIGQKSALLNNTLQQASERLV